MVHVAPTFGPGSGTATTVTGTWVPNGDTPWGYRVWVNPYDLQTAIDVELSVFLAHPSIGGWGGLPVPHVLPLTWRPGIA